MVITFLDCCCQSLLVLQEMADFSFSAPKDQPLQLEAELNGDIWGSRLKVADHGLFLLLYFQMQIAEYALGSGRKYVRVLDVQQMVIVQLLWQRCQVLNTVRYLSQVWGLCIAINTWFLNI